MGFVNNLLSRLGYVKKRSRVADLVDFNEGASFFASFETERVRFDPYHFYTRNGTVRAAVDRIADSIAHVPVFISKDDNEENKLESPEVTQFLTAPNSEQSMIDLLRSIDHSLELWGDTFIEWVRDEDGLQAFNLLPSRVSIKAASRDERIYRYEVNSRRVTFVVSRKQNREDIIHGTYNDPGKDFKGLSPLESALDCLIMSQRVEIFNERFIKNGAKINGIFTLEDDISEEDFDRMQLRIMQKYVGEHNAGKPLILTKGWKYTGTTQTPKDMDFLLQLKWCREQMLAALGVPPVMVGIFEFANYANADIQKRIFWEDTILPRLAKIEGIMTRVIRRLLNDNSVAFHFDTQDIKALQQNEIDRINNNNSRLDRGVLTINEARSEEGRDDVDGGDVPFIGAGRIPLTDFTDEGPREIGMPSERNGERFTQRT